jgi:hypothetical protein
MPKVKVDSQKGKTSSQTGDLVCVQRNPLYRKPAAGAFGAKAELLVHTS